MNSLLNQQLTDFFKFERKIKEYFGYKEQWEILPLDDMRDVYWEIRGEVLHYQLEPFPASTVGLSYLGTAQETTYETTYSAEIIHRTVLRKDGLVLIAIDTNCDNNRFLAVLNESLEIK